MTTTSISYELALRMGMSEREITSIVRGALLHDLGKNRNTCRDTGVSGKVKPSGHAYYADPCKYYGRDSWDRCG